MYNITLPILGTRLKQIREHIGYSQAQLAEQLNCKQNAISNLELLNTGMRLRHFRNQCGMTQKALGVAVGFPESSADVRIAQYESGARTPKRELLCRLAAALGVSPAQLAVPRIKNSEELCSLLAALEDECGIELSPRSDNAKANYQSYWKGATDIENL